METSLFNLNIVIVTWKHDDLLRNCLDSISQSCGVLPSIIIVDNACLESTEILCSRYSNTIYVPICQNLGFSGGNNIGVRLCNKQFILLLNNDTIIQIEPFTLMMNYLDNNPHVGCVQGTLVRPYYNNTLDACGLYLNQWGIVSEYFVNQKEKDVILRNKPVFAAKGACMMFRKEILNYIFGPLFYDFFFNNYEEVDFCHRIWISGLEVHFLKTPPIYHLCGQSLKTLPVQEVEAQKLSNQFFSLLSLLNPVHGCWILAKILAYHCLREFRKIIFLQRFDFEYLVIAVVKTWSNRRKINEIQIGRRKYMEKKQCNYPSDLLRQKP